MKLKLLFLSLICLSQINIHCAAAEVYPASEAEVYPDSEHHDKIVYGIMSQVSSSLSDDEKKELDAMYQENLALKNEIDGLKKSLNDARYVASRDAQQLEAKIYDLQRQNAALHFDLKQAKNAAAMAQASYTQAQDNIATATKHALSWQSQAIELQARVNEWEKIGAGLANKAGIGTPTNHKR